MIGGSLPTYADAAPPKYADGRFDVVPKRFQELYIARLQRGPVQPPAVKSFAHHPV